MNKRNILEYFEESESREPEKAALILGTYTLTFSELGRKARAIGSSLIERGYRRKAIAVLMDKHPDTVCAFLGALYAGCFYICIDPDMPDSRIRDIAERSRASAVICCEASSRRARVLSGRAEILYFEELCESEIDREALGAIRERATDSDPAYIVFTSGSSGEPKGVCASHRSLIDYADALISALPFDSETVFGNQAPLYYDAPLKEILPVLTKGASMIFIPKELFLFPTRLCEFIRKCGVNTLCWAASALAHVSSSGALESCDMSHLKLICFGSEVLSRGEFEKWRRACPRAVLVNLYGPTEATGMSTYWIAKRELAPDEPIPIGRPFKNTDIMLIGEDGREAMDGERGEIYIRGSAVALGYFGDNYMTEDSFVQNPLHEDYPERVYRTGDMARYNNTGELVYLGRRDLQIKIMGRRIEPYEVERSACEHGGVSQSALIYDHERERTVLFYVGEAEERIVQSFLSLRLPRYMLPRRCVRLEDMPRLENGKLDRAELSHFIDENVRMDHYAQA